MNDQKIQYIIENYQHKTDKEMADILGYCASSIKRIRLGLRLLKKSRGITFAICHPDRKNCGFGLCKNCYDKHLKQTNKEYAKNQADNCKKWKSANKDKIRENSIKYVSNNREKVDKGRWLCRIRNAFGLFENEYNNILENQNGKCAICKESTSYRLGVDHSHRSGNIRGLLCRKCNLLLGLLDDSIAKAKDVISYLEKYDGET